MKKNFIAIAVKGKEFLYKRSSMIAVPARSALKIRDLLNRNKFELRDGEVWHIYENDSFDNDYISREINSYRKGRVVIHRMYA